MSNFSIHPDTRLGPVSLTVADLGRALRFYKDLLGLQSLRRQKGAETLGTAAGAPLVTLVENQRARAKPPRTTGLYHFAVLLPTRADLASTLRHLAENNYPIQGASDHGVSEAVYLADLDGNGIEIYSDRPKADWPWQQGELRMFTGPLNVEGLLREDDGQWRGLSGGTRIGHVHLHVAELAEAQHFYCDLLGFDLMQRFDSSALFLSAGGYHHHIGLNTWAGLGAPPPPPDAVGLRHFSIQFAHDRDLMETARRLEGAGIRLEHGGNGNTAAGGFFVRDPSENGLLLDLLSTDESQ